jgi:sulfatase modifying factor 1
MHVGHSWPLPQRRHSQRLSHALVAIAGALTGGALAAGALLILARAERVVDAAAAPLASVPRGAALALITPAPAAPEPSLCPEGMVDILGRYCIDVYEASTVIIDEQGLDVREHSPFEVVIDQRVRARSVRGVLPQGHISRDAAALACRAADKRLCSDREWVTACRGQERQAYPYGRKHEPQRCNDSAPNPLAKVFGKPPPPERLGYFELNHPMLNQSGGLAKTGSFSECKNSFGVHDMVGNLHEWTAERGGTFRGGYYRDVTHNGDGCGYVTTVHGRGYHDYSTGFRCCADISE